MEANNEAPPIPGAAGAYAALTSESVQAQETTRTPQRARLDLNGAWDQSIAGSFLRVVHVPSSNRPIGKYDLTRNVASPKLAPGEHAFLCLDAIAYFARVYCNGQELGRMVPYVPHEFDISSLLREHSNVIRVSLSDLSPEPAAEAEIALGVNPGWEAYGGIIRDIWLEIRPSTFIENARLSYKLNADRSVAHCVVRVFVRSRGAVAGKADVKLLRMGQTLASGGQDFAVGLRFRARRVRFRHQGSGTVVARDSGLV
jgi:hypothetical protein